MKDLIFADPMFDQLGKVDLLLGCNVLQDVLTHDTRRGTSKQPIVMKPFLDGLFSVDTYLTKTLLTLLQLLSVTSQPARAQIHSYKDSGKRKRFPLPQVVLIRRRR